MKNELNYHDVPRSWALCFQHDCPLRETCLRHAAGALMPAGTTHHEVVFPSARQGNSCKLYVKNERVTMARGMKGIFHNLSSWEVQKLRTSLIECIGSKSNFYRYRKGMYVINPTLQSRIAAIFHAHRPGLQPHFDETIEAFYFPEQ